jgi:peptidyl-prolyl cis-trans isomerase B (cyclophilin B)
MATAAPSFQQRVHACDSAFASAASPVAKWCAPTRRPRRSVATPTCFSIPVTTPTESVQHSRRAALISAASVAVATALPPHTAVAEEEALPPITDTVYLDFSVDGEPAGRVVIGVFGTGPAPLAAKRFTELATGSTGVSYRRTQIDVVRAGEFVRDAGIRTFSYAETTQSTALAGGETADAFAPELDAPGRLFHDRAGLVSLVALSGTQSDAAKERLTAMNGRLVTVRDGRPAVPNGTAFSMTVAASPSLDGIAAVVGCVLEGMDVVGALAALPANRNADDSGLFFAVAKSVGDKRALVREKGNGRPLAKVVVTACGRVQSR